MAFGADGGVGKARKLVESVIKDLGIDPEESSLEASSGGAAWRVARGSAHVMIALNPAGEGKAARLRIISPLILMDEDTSLALLRRLLELNGTELPGVAFGVISDKVVLVAERSVAGLDRAEVAEMLSVIGFYADKYDDDLVEEFGGTRVWDLD
ncbi:MAG: YbjN domain-containing protein [Deltaproteobacteria bacterium]|nr:YbjN domain-containing protein [Deltaproteobacteria bacterium]